jgi:hypothetical protein
MAFYDQDVKGKLCCSTSFRLVQAISPLIVDYDSTFGLTCSKHYSLQSQRLT